MAARIVYVHGAGPKPRAELLKSQWDRALFGRDMGELSHLAYWAPVLHERPLPDPVPDPLEGASTAVAEAEREREAPRPPALEDPAQFMARTATEARAGGAAGRVPGGGALGGWLRDMTYMAEALALAEEPRPGPGEEPLPEALPLPRPARTALFRLLVQHVFEDVHAYFFGAAGRAIRQAVTDALDAAGAGEGDDGREGPLVVVGHSLGSVVAYEVLAARNPRVDLFVTLGSPLAVTEVQDCLAAPPAVPSRTGLWLNASDARDLVALDHTLRPEYAPPGRITDVLVRNNGENHHAAAEYLSDVLVRDPVRRVCARTR
ncbi:hypothetical protein I3F58_04980 [Streptomyces sp. MUM 203J]|uniref:hypothetical protein n=1 Tax=Streptomyces sp. MUM 203J TaxID=2791990 RepID=UPI001F03CE78|nr:hypothetical protein [Streptomyces sp. MUM 203J]MCH0538920.1 hypothetical protein [Streptomyces sp. MUM 203J]